jgi:cobalt-zinc-cadmium efflux system membrane fusion protein
MKPSFVRVSIALVLAAGAGSACRRAPAPAEQAQKAETLTSEKSEQLPTRVALTAAAISEAGIATWQVKPVDLEHMLVLTGSVGHDENRLLQVAANVRGRVATIPVDLGALVSKGDPLLVVESVDLGKAREELLRELSSLRVAARAYERAKALVDAKAISSGEFQAREGEYLSRKAAAQGAERTLHLYGETDEQIESLRESVESNGALAAGDGPRLTLRAPFAGRVIERKVTPGSLFEALQPLLTLADLRSVWVFVEAYEKDLSLLRKGLSVTIRADAYRQETFHGRIDFVGSVLDTTTRSVKLRVTVQNPSEKLKPGMFVKATVDVPRPEFAAKAVAAVPQSALQTLEGRTVLFVEVEPGVFERQFAEVGHSFEGFTEILAGIKTGQVVVTEGSFVLKSEFAKASLAEHE